MHNLDGKTAFITGGAQGIGLGIAKACLASGMQIVLADIKAGRLDEARTTLGHADRVITIALDVRDIEALRAAADRTEEVFGNVHLVCNNAGVGSGQPVTTVSREVWSRTLDINLVGTLNGIQVFTPRLLRHGEGGHIVNTASITGFAQQAGAVPYGVSKAGIIAMTEVLRVELAGKHAHDRWQNMYGAGAARWGSGGPPPGLVSASVLCPDAVDTEISVFHTNLDDDDETRRRKQAYLKHAGIQLVHPDALGKRVLEAVLNDELYIFSDGTRSRQLVEDRLRAMLDAFERQFPPHQGSS